MKKRIAPRGEFELCTCCASWGTCVPISEAERVKLAFPPGTTRACTVCVYERRNHLKPAGEK